MRKLIAAAALLAVTSAHAAEELKFGDVNYFLKQSQFQFSLDGKQNYEKQTQDSTEQALEKREFLFSAALAYGINDRLNVFTGIDYAYYSHVVDRTTTTNGRYFENGAGNPAVGANYRLFSQNEARYNLDFGAIAKFNVQDAKTGTSTGNNKVDGNHANGRSSLELNARTGRKWNEANEWQLAAGAVYWNDGDYTDKRRGVNVDQDSSVDFFVRATWQYRPVNEFMIMLSAQGKRVGKVDGKDSNGANWESDAHNDFNFGFTAKYLITEKIIARFNYTQAHLSDYDTVIAGTNDEYKKRRNAAWGLGVDFLF